MVILSVCEVSFNTFFLCQTLLDPYFKGLAMIEKEPSCEAIKKVEFDFEHKRMSKEEIRELIFLEILE